MSNFYFDYDDSSDDGVLLRLCPSSQCNKNAYLEDMHEFADEADSFSNDDERRDFHFEHKIDWIESMANSHAIVNRIYFTTEEDLVKFMAKFS